MGGRVNNTKARTLPYDSELIAIVKERGLNSACLHILVYLRSRMNAKRKTPVCWPKQLTMVEDTGLDERTVRRALYNLKNAGLIRIGKHKPKGNLLQYEFIPWWPLCMETTGQKCRSMAVKNAGLQPVNNVGNLPVNNVCLESNQVESIKENKRNESPPPPGGSMEEKGKNSFSENQKPNRRNGLKQPSPDRCSKKATPHPAPRSKKARLEALKKSDPDLFNRAERYAQLTLSRRRAKAHLPPVDETEDYLQAVIFNALLGDRQEAFKKWLAGHGSRPKRKWITPEEMAGKRLR